MQYKCVVQKDTHVARTVLQVRLGEPEKRGFKLAANLSGLSLSSWARERLRSAAIRDLENAGKKVPFLESDES